LRLVQGPLGPFLADHPRALTGGPEAKRVFAPMMTMKKIDVAAIENARRGDH
jgi:hypothetical protein